MRKRPSLLLLACLGLGALSAMGAELTGVVRDNLGNGLSSLTVKASYFDSASGWIQTSTTTDDTGHFGFSAEPGNWNWNIEVPPGELNGRGYLSVSSSYAGLVDDTTIRLVTRKLDFTHRIAGRLAGEAGQPLAGYALRARITENNALFETNLVTGLDGSFLLRATPAVWTFHGLTPPDGDNTVRVFGEQAVEVEVTNLEKQVTLTAPAATSTILVTATNLHEDWQIAVETEAFGRSYRVLKYMPWEDVPLAFEVFNGAWRVSATNSHPDREFGPLSLPAPLLVAVTNEGVSVTLAGIRTPPPTLHTQRVHLVTSSGAAVTNSVTMTAYSGTAAVRVIELPQRPPRTNDTPGVVGLSLQEGRWTITASTKNWPSFNGWEVSREVVITTNEPPPEITLVFPDPGTGPRLFGTVTASGGPPAGLHLVYLQLKNNGTNYLASLGTDGFGQFGTNVPPGRWEVQTYGSCPLASAVVVSNQDVEVNFEFLVAGPGEPIDVSFSVIDDRGEPALQSYVSLYGFDYQYVDPSFTHALSPAIWSVSLDNQYGVIFYSGPTPTYQLSPTLNWQLPPGTPPTNLVLVTRHTTARIEGRLRDEQGRLLSTGYAAAWTSVDGTNFWAYSIIGSGYFSLNVFPGEWEVGVEVLGSPTVGANPGFVLVGSPFDSGPPPSLYTRPPSQFIRVSNDVVRCEFVTTNIPDRVTLSVTVVREDGGPVSGVTAFAQGPVAFEYQFVDLNGRATLSIPPGPQWISAHPGVYEVIANPQLWPTVHADLSAPSNHILLVARRPVGCIAGTISNAPALGLQPEVFATARIDGTNYSSSVFPDVDGDYCAPAIPGPWSVGIYSGPLPGNGLQSVAPIEVTVPPGGESPRADFALIPIDGDFRTARFSPPVLLPDGGLRLELEGQAPLYWRIERSENLRDWTRVAMDSTASRTLVIEEPLGPSQRASFYRAVWVR